MIDFNQALKFAKFLPGEGYSKYWEKFNNEGIKIKKLEFLQTYDFIDGNEDFKNKNYDKFVEMLKDFDKISAGGKDNIKRIHYIEEPLNEYLEMEYYTYLINAKYGQKVRITKDRKLFPEKVYDFVLFENGNLFLLDFGNNDTWKGAWHITDKKIIKEFSNWFDEIFSKSEDFKNMLSPNPIIIQKMKESGIL